MLRPDADATGSGRGVSGTPSPRTGLSPTPTPNPRNRLLAIAFLSLAGVVATYLLAVRTAAGQRFENAALAGASQHSQGSWYDHADRWLNFITAESFAVSLLVIAAVGAVRRRWLLALCGVATAGGALLVTRVVKNSLPDRPDLTVAGYQTHNSLPSGHATAAMALFFAMLIVVSRRWYLPVTVLGLPGAVGSGVATVAANWHRLSDTIAADLVALAAGTTGLALMAHLGWVRGSLRKSNPRLLLAVSLLALVVTAAGVAYLFRYHAAGDSGFQDRDAYWSAQALALGAALFTTAVMLAVVDSVESVRRSQDIDIRRSHSFGRNTPG